MNYRIILEMMGTREIEIDAVDLADAKRKWSSGENAIIDDDIEEGNVRSVYDEDDRELTDEFFAIAAEWTPSELAIKVCTCECGGEIIAQCCATNDIPLLPDGTLDFRKAGSPDYDIECCRCCKCNHHWEPDTEISPHSPLKKTDE